MGCGVFTFFPPDLSSLRPQDRALCLPALPCSHRLSTDACEFEYPAIAHLCAVHSADRLAMAHAEFLESAQKADGLYLDFAHFLERELTKLHQKSLP